MRVLAPEGFAGDLDALLRSLADPAVRLRPFDERGTSFCAALSQALFTSPEARRHPELQALAFWLRRAELTALERAFSSLGGPDTVLVPAGLVFHLAPGNVDTIFVYSWVLSLLVGNANILRLSSKESPQGRLLTEAVAAVIRRPEHEAVRKTSALLAYGHELEPTAAISRACDLRVTWGGDATVEAIRKAPLPPSAREVVFPDRFSLGVIAAERLVAAGEVARRELVDAFFNDTYWFDQRACSSPRLVVWVGAPDVCREAAAWFATALEARAARGYEVQAATAVAKLTFACRSVLDGVAERIDWRGNALTVLPVSRLAGVRADHVGAGMLFQFEAPRLVDLAPHLERKDQTVTYWGFGPGELRELVAAANGRGGDRFVPVGRALSFSRFWDGHDLLQAFTRRVHVLGDAPAGEKPA